MLRRACGSGMPVLSESIWARSSARASSSSATRPQHLGPFRVGLEVPHPGLVCRPSAGDGVVDGLGALVDELDDLLLGHRVDDRDGLAIARALAKLVHCGLYGHASSHLWVFRRRHVSCRPGRPQLRTVGPWFSERRTKAKHGYDLSMPSAVIACLTRNDRRKASSTGICPPKRLASTARAGRGEPPHYRCHPAERPGSRWWTLSSTHMSDRNRSQCRQQRNHCPQSVSQQQEPPRPSTNRCRTRPRVRYRVRDGPPKPAPSR